MKKIYGFLLIFGLYLILPAGVQAAASLSLSPSTGGTTVGQTFTVDLKLDTAGASTTGVDVVFTFNPTILEVVAFNQGTLYGSGQRNPTLDNAGGKITYHPSVTNAIYNYTTSGTPGTLATVTFKGKIAGSAVQAAFTCTAGTTQSDTNVWSSNQDIISCAATTGGSYTITAGSGTTGTPTNTPTPTSTTGTGGISGSGTGGGTNPTPSVSAQLPESGVVEWTLLIFALGIFFIFGGTKLLLTKNIQTAPTTIEQIENG